MGWIFQGYRRSQVLCRGDRRAAPDSDKLSRVEVCEVRLECCEGNVMEVRELRMIVLCKDCS